MRAVLALALLGALGGVAGAEPLEATVRAAVGRALPAELGVAQVHLPRGLEALDVDPARVRVELPAVLRAGRASVRVAVPRRAPVYVPVTIGALVEVAVTVRALPEGAVVTAADLAVEHHAVPAGAAAAPGLVPGATTTRAVPAGAVVAPSDLVLPRPLARGSAITVELRTGRVHVRGTATLETAARPGQPASARLAHTRTLVRGTLRAPATLVVEGGPR